MTNTTFRDDMARTFFVSCVTLAALVGYVSAETPTLRTFSAVAVDLDNEGEDVLGCLLDRGYAPQPGGRFLFDLDAHLVVEVSDRESCGESV